MVGLFISICAMVVCFIIGLLVGTTEENDVIHATSEKTETIKSVQRVYVADDDDEDRRRRANDDAAEAAMLAACCAAMAACCD